MSYQAVSHARSHRVPFAGMGRAPGYMGSDALGSLAPYARVAAMEAARKIMAVVAAQPQASRAAIIRAALDQIRPGLFAKVESLATGVVAGGGSPATAYEEALRIAFEAEYERGTPGQLAGCSGCDGGVGTAAGAAAFSAGANAVTQGLKTVGDMVSIFSGAPKQAERAAKANAAAAASNAAAAGTTAAAQVEIARIQAETARLTAGQSQGGSKLPIYIGVGVGVLALVGTGLFFAFRK